LVPSSPAVMLAMSALLLLPLAIALGTGLPLLLRSVSATSVAAPRASGLLLGANTIGGLLRSLRAGFRLVPAVGCERGRTFLAFPPALVGGPAPVLAADEPRRRLEALALPALVLGLVVRMHPSIELPFLLDAWYEPTRSVIEGPSPRFRENVVFL